MLQGRLLLRLYDDLALVSVSDAGRRYIRVICKRQVYDAALVGRHGFKGDWPSAVHNTLRDPPREVSERVVATLLVARDVHKQVDALTHPLGADEAHNELERTQSLSSPSNQQA